MGKYLTKCFGRVFYKQHIGFLIASYVLLLGYGLFIKTAGHIPAGQERTIYLVLLLNFVHSPVITLLAFVLWFIYTIRTWFFVIKVSQMPEYLFWHYSATALPYHSQIMAWWWFQLYLSLPMIFYSVLAMVCGIVIGEVNLPFLAVAYLLLLTLISGIVYVYWFNSRALKKTNWLHLTAIVRRFPKSSFSIFFFELITNRKLALVLTKAISCALVIGAVSFFEDVDEPLRFLAILCVGLALIHVVLVYLIQDFFARKMYFLHQLPYHRGVLYINEIIRWFLLLLPEFFLASLFFPLPLLPLFVHICMAGILVLRSLCCFEHINMLRFLKWSFSWFCMAVLFALFDLSVLFSLLNLVVAFIVFYSRYYRRDALA
ncbi:hypothetical protein [Olivibacter sp. XZL3]|uniref:hypothetical protein n=1 Tax=Olivibacter sp. XZL3 TaxID=1735116 RepID=UPI0010646D3F|nr:hypothetical protein [Olivibacter sp. XZL3]